MWLQVPIVPIVLHEYLGPDSFYSSAQKRFDRGGMLHLTVLPAIEPSGFVCMV
jgi:hypothetical protein